MAGEELHGQGKIIHEVRRHVDRWRGFMLGSAREPYADLPPRYEPTMEDERAVSETTMGLLHHWFRREPHVLGRPPHTTWFKYWPHQRRLVETFIYLYEVRGIRRTEDLWLLGGEEPLGRQRDPWAKLGGQLATGSGKTKMMSLLIAWAYLNAVREGEEHLGIGRHTVLIAPGLFVRDRLFSDFFPPDGSPSVFTADPVVPPAFENDWHLKVYSPVTCPLKLDPREGALVITNRHQLERTRDDYSDLASLSPLDRQTQLFFESGEPRKLEDVQSPLCERFARSRGLFIINDEAHHVWDEPGHARFEQKAKEKAKAGDEDAQTAMAWIGAIRRLNGSADRAGRVALQADLSATLFQETGSTKKTKGETDFKPREYFRHTAVNYGLAEAIQDGIVKRPILERVEVRDKKSGDIQPLIREGQPNAWEKYRNILSTGIQRWKKVKEQLAAEGDARKPILFVLCNDRGEAREVANYLSHGEATREDLSHRTPTGYIDPDTNERLFVSPTPEGGARSTVVEIHIGQKEESNEEEWEKIRAAVNAIDHDEVVVKRDGGEIQRLHNPYNVVVSVMMIKEGWDVRNVKVIVPLRPCDSRTLTEQTLGRGLRKMHAPAIDDDGGIAFKSEELYVIEHPSFKAILDQVKDIIEEKGSDEIEHTPEYVLVQQKEDEAARLAADVRLVRFEGLVQVVPDWRKSFDLNRLPPLAPRIAWLPEIAETEINTFLKKALESGEEKGQTFTLPSTPSYRDFDHVLELAYAIPLLRELRTSYQHKNSVKGVVQGFLERKTFAVPAGMPLSFDRSLEDPTDARIALGNLARADVIEGVRKALLPALREAFQAERAATEAQLSVRRSSELLDYQAPKKHVLEGLKRCTFRRSAVENGDELRTASLIDKARDVVGWVYNHRSGVGYAIEYEWQGYSCPYYPDFIVRAKLGAVFHNFIIEVKGRLDDRDKHKAQKGQRHCELLTQYDGEPWHYLLLIENEAFGRKDVTWWQEQSAQTMADLLRRHESLPLFPDTAPDSGSQASFKFVERVRADDQYRTAVPVFDLAVVAGGFSESQAPEPTGWARIRTYRRITPGMFAAKVVGHSMEKAIPAGSWGLFRAYPAGEAPSPMALDGHRVVVQLRNGADPETGGQYTLKRWRVAKVAGDGAVEEIELKPDNSTYPALHVSPAAGEVRVVAEFLEVLG